MFKVGMKTVLCELPCPPFPPFLRNSPSFHFHGHQREDGKVEARGHLSVFFFLPSGCRPKKWGMPLDKAFLFRIPSPLENKTGQEYEKKDHCSPYLLSSLSFFRGSRQTKGGMRTGRRLNFPPRTFRGFGRENKRRRNQNLFPFSSETFPHFTWAVGMREGEGGEERGGARPFSLPGNFPPSESAEERKGRRTKNFFFRTAFQRGGEKRVLLTSGFFFFSLFFFSFSFFRSMEGGTFPPPFFFSLSLSSAGNKKGGRSVRYTGYWFPFSTSFFSFFPFLFTAEIGNSMYHWLPPSRLFSFFPEQKRRCFFFSGADPPPDRGEGALWAGREGTQCGSTSFSVFFPPLALAAAPK